MLYFLYSEYEPNTAPANRALAYLRELSRNAVKANAVFFFPDRKFSKLQENLGSVKVTYMWEHLYINHPLLKYLSYLLYLVTFFFRLKKGDKVYMYGMNDVKGFFLKRRGIDVFFETTEHPEVSMGGSRLYKPSMNRYLEYARRCSGMIVISTALRDFFVSHGVSAERVHVVNMTVDSKRFDGIEKSGVKEKYIAYCGTASNNKDGVDNLIKAFALLHERQPDVKLYIIGDAPSSKDESNNLHLIDSLGVKDSVVFTGRIETDKMPQVLKDAVALALARPDNKQAKYGFPTKLGEYLLTANPVVVTSVGDIPLFLEDGKSALIAPPGNPELFAEKLNWAIENPDKAKAIGENGREVALRSFNAAVETRKLLDIMFSN